MNSPGPRRTEATRNLVLLFGSEEFCLEASRELERREANVELRIAQGLQELQSIAFGKKPGAILAEDRRLAPSEGRKERGDSLRRTLQTLAALAPVVWVGNGVEGAEIAKHVASLPADFVPRTPLCIPAAVSMVLRRLRVHSATGGALGLPPTGAEFDGRDFGGLLRHELNNPLTGILGNAELLLLEVRRGRLSLPAEPLQRLEIIATLAMRMRETVRHLSDYWEHAGGGAEGARDAVQKTPGEAKASTVSG